MTEEVHPRRTAVILGVLFVVTIGFFVWLGGRWYDEIDNPVKPLVVNQEVLKQVKAEAAGFGAEVYEKTNNPVKDQLPKTAALVPNALEDAYVNPFE
jgi:hypothetical protein